MKRLAKLQPHKTKRSLTRHCAAVLAFLLFIVVIPFSRTAQAAHQTVPKWFPTPDIGVDWELTFGDRVGQTITREQFNAAVEREIREKYAFLEIEGDYWTFGRDLGFQYKTYRSISMGEHTFERYFLGTRIEHSVFLEAGSGREIRYVPFFILNNHILLECTTTGNMAVPTGARGIGYGITSSGSFTGNTTTHSFPSSPARYADIRHIAGEPHTRARLFNNATAAPFHVERFTRWLDLTSYRRGMSWESSVRTFDQLTGGSHEGISSFSPREQGQFGVFIFRQADVGMRFREFIESTRNDPNFDYRFNDAETFAWSIPLPPSLQYLGENDVITIGRDDETDEIIFIVEKGDPVSGDCCCCTANASWFSRIIDTLNAIGANIYSIATTNWLERIHDVLVAGFDAVLDAIDAISVELNYIFNDPLYNEAGERRPTLWERITDGVGNVLMGGGDFLDGAGSFLDGIAAVLRAIFEPLFNFLENIVQMIIDTLIYLFVPNAGFFENRIEQFQLEFHETMPFIKESQEFFDEFLYVLEYGISPVLGVSIDDDDDYTPSRFETFQSSVSFTVVDGMRVPVFYGTIFEQRVRIVDLSFFHPLRNVIHTLMILAAYVMLARHILKKIPGLLGGVKFT
jgi:hypothetical protein